MRNRSLAGWVWVVVFLIWFASQPLPNNPGMSRWQLIRAWPWAVLDAIDPPTEPGSPPRGWWYVLERIPIWGAAAWIVLGSWGWGRLILRHGALPTWTVGETYYLSYLLGLSGVSVFTLIWGRLVGLHPWVWRGLLTVGMVYVVRELWSLRRAELRKQGDKPVGGLMRSPRWSTWREWWGWCWALPFLMAMLLGASSPPTDFDAKAYHLVGPKEWYLQGRISFLEHNVYTSFPFLTEMLVLVGMLVYGDWYPGAVAGQVVLMTLLWATAWGVWCTGCRWGTRWLANAAVWIYLSTPWVYRLAIIPYAEGGWGAYTFATGMLGLWWCREHDAEGRGFGRQSMIVSCYLGGLAGSAMACKYPGLLTAVLPAAFLLLACWWKRRVVLTKDAAWYDWCTTWGGFLLGLSCSIGPWLIKNVYDTGNPVYPLAWSLLGGRDLDAAWAEQWQRAHPSQGWQHFSLKDLVLKLHDIAAVNDWQSPLLFAFAPWGALGPTYPWWGLVGWSAWLFFAWWLFMHHIDRFWTPIIPWLAVLAGRGASQISAQRIASVLLGVVGMLQLVFCVTGLGGYNAGWTAWEHARRIGASTAPQIAWCNEAWRQGLLPTEFKPLCVGEAQVFDAEFPCLYHTVFDRSLLEELCRDPSAQELGHLADPQLILKRLHERGVTHVLINWGEILRYRRTYGYSEFITPKLIYTLHTQGVLGEPLMAFAAVFRRPWSELAPEDQLEVMKWGPELKRSCGGTWCFQVGEIYPVLNKH